ncbi:MAG TPA: 7-cyano-7-deazaguanine synthase [Candidatus Hypogeohydataceae bacterium YC41]
MTKAVALLSGGLDSTLAVHLMKSLGVEVVALNFTTVFCRCNRGGSCKSEAKKVSEALRIPVKMLNITASFLRLVKRPKYGYGKNMNPCIDCRINMFRMAGEFMREIGADFIITGEVLGQRPMSQRREAMKIIEKEAGVEGLVLRPLCARHMPPTIPEKVGLVDRQKLLDFKGRGRKGQMQLADVFELKDYPCPAGGCLLTDPMFAHRIKELFNHDIGCELGDIHLLKVGRHYRLDDRTKAVVGRREEENHLIEHYAQPTDALLMLTDLTGPLCLVRGSLTEENLRLAAGLVARSSKARTLFSVRITVKLDGVERVIETAPLDAARAQELLIVKKKESAISREWHCHPSEAERG